MSGIATFGSVDAAGDGEGVGLTRIDHVGQTMNQIEMPSWLLFYTAIFNTRKTPLVDVIDPAGIVRSRAVETSDGKFRLTLNGSENRRTLAGHFIAESFGSSVQHLAFATDDIFATASSLRAAGFTALTISPNYYDDVEARFGLDPGLADRLRAANILYDRDENGEFFQLYAPMFGEGFIVEIVERRARLQGLRRGERTVPHRRAEAPSETRGNAAHRLGWARPYGVAGNILPGLRMSSGSSACLMVRMKSVPAPSSCSMKAILPWPMPCSPVQVPSIAMARMLSRPTNASVASMLAGSSRSISTSTWKLPSPTWPTIGAVMPCSAMSASVATMHSASREIGTQTSVDSPVAPGLSAIDAQ